jgi:hypothetical protein
MISAISVIKTRNLSTVIIGAVAIVAAAFDPEVLLLAIDAFLLSTLQITMLWSGAFFVALTNIYR